MEKKAIIFDLDGTLVDVLPLFIQIFNRLAADFNYAPIGPEEVPAIRKINLKKFLFSKLGLRFWRYGEFLRKSQADYLEHVAEIEFFPGMPALFRTLKDLGYAVGVISSNTEPAITALLAKHALVADFIASTTLLGKARTIKKTLAQVGLNHEFTLYVGDELRDIVACQKAGIPIIAVGWGLNDRTALAATGVPVVDTPAELEAKLLEHLPLAVPAPPGRLKT